MTKAQLAAAVGRMKTVAILAGLIALVVGGAVPHHHDIKLKSVDAQFVAMQKKVMYLFEHVEQLDYESEYYKLGKVYDIEANIDKYTNKNAVEEFLTLYRMGFMPKHLEFSVFYEKMRDQAIALFHVFYYAKDFETFYQTAAWAKVYLNPGQFLYAYYIAVLQRPDTDGIVLPAPYEVYPELFINKEVLNKIYYTKMQDGLMAHDDAVEYGIVQENDYYVYYANYSSYFSYPNMEHKLSYFTEDIGLNAYYYYFHTHLPFWWNSNKFGEFKERRGEIYFYFYQQLLARYYLERLSNGLGEIPEFSWFAPYKTGYYPHMAGSYLPFVQRSNYYDIHTEKNYENIRFLDTYEKTFFQYMQDGQFKAFGKDVDFTNPKSINFVGNYWQTNADLYNEDVTKDYQHSYEHVARHVLGGSPKHYNKYTFMPSALDFYQTSLRDPAFYQLYQRIMKYFVDYKEYMPFYKYEDLHFPGVKINDVEVSELVTYFEYYDFNATNAVIYGKNELKSYPSGFLVRQPRLNHKPFSVKVNVKSDVASDAVFKIFIGPKYDSHGFPIVLEENWMKFYELDWFIQKLTPGENKIERKSSEFVLFKEDSVPIYEIYKYLDQGKVPYDMSVNPANLPKRLMLPKGTPGGFPFQLYVFVYPFNGVVKEQDAFKSFVMDNKPFAYPFDRPLNEIYFKQPNMFFKDVSVYHKEPFYSYEMNVPSFFTQKV